jgi:hypothetical protein
VRLINTHKKKKKKREEERKGEEEEERQEMDVLLTCFKWFFSNHLYCQSLSLDIYLETFFLLFFYF